MQLKLIQHMLDLSVGIYLEQLVGKKIKGQTSQITAVVQKVLKNTESETDDYTSIR